MSTPPHRPRGLTPARAWAYLGMVLGGTVSLAANLTHSLLTPDHPLGAVLFSVWWPVLLWVTTEIILRNTFTGAWSFLAWAGLTPVGVIAAVASYQHMSGLLAHYGETRFVSLGGPLAVDGLMILSTGLLFVSKPGPTVQTTVYTETTEAVDADEHADEDADAAWPALPEMFQTPPPPARLHQVDRVYAIQTVSKIRQQQIDDIRAAVPDPLDRVDLTWDQISAIVGITGRESLKRIRAALTTADQHLDERRAL